VTNICRYGIALNDYLPNTYEVNGLSKAFTGDSRMLVNIDELNESIAHFIRGRKDLPML
jgi:hypothetical protein